MTHICIAKLTIIGSDNGLSPGRHQAIIWTTAGILLIGPLGTQFSEIFSRNSNILIQDIAFENVVCEKAAILSQPQCVNADMRCIAKVTETVLWYIFIIPLNSEVSARDGVGSMDAVVEDWFPWWGL